MSETLSTWPVGLQQELLPFPDGQIIGKADVHVHTRYSDGKHTVAEVLDYVARTDLSVIAISDHDTIEGALEANERAEALGIEIIVAEEVSSRDGHILGLFMQERVPPDMSALDTVHAIHEQGGIAIAAHPFYRDHHQYLDLREAVSRWSSEEVSTHVPPIVMRETGRRPLLGVGKLVLTVPFDAIEVDNGTPFLRFANRRALRFNRTHDRLPETGSSDAHIREAIGKSYTLFAGTTAQEFRQALLAGQTVAVDSRYQATDLAAYLAYWVAMPMHRKRRIANRVERLT